MGYSVPELLNLFYEKETIHLGKEKYERELDFEPSYWLSCRRRNLLIRIWKVVVKKGKKITKFR
jgi:hypothetical protein